MSLVGIAKARVCTDEGSKFNIIGAIAIFSFGHEISLSLWPVVNNALCHIEEARVGPLSNHKFPHIDEHMWAACNMMHALVDDGDTTGTLRRNELGTLRKVRIHVF